MSKNKSKKHFEWSHLIRAFRLILKKEQREEQGDLFYQLPVQFASLIIVKRPTLFVTAINVDSGLTNFVFHFLSAVEAVLTVELKDP